MLKIYKNKEGKKLYPVCSWEKNQHKLYNASDRARIRWFDTYSDEASDEVDKIDRLIEIFDSQIVDGIVYATYQDRCDILDVINAYNCRSCGV